MKKKVFIIIGIILIIVIIGLLYFKFFIKKEDNSKVYEINMTKLQEKIDNKDTFILVMIQTGCVHCASYVPTLKEVSNEYNVEFYTLNRSNLTAEEYTNLKKIASANSTPTTVFIVNGEEKTTLNRLVGNVPKDRLIEKLISEGYINE